MQFRDQLQTKYDLSSILNVLVRDLTLIPLIEEIFRVRAFKDCREEATSKAFYILCKEGYLDFVKQAVAEGCDPDDPIYKECLIPFTLWPAREDYEHIKTPLQAARAAGKEEVVQYLESVVKGIPHSPRSVKSV